MNQHDRNQVSRGDDIADFIEAAFVVRQRRKRRERILQSILDKLDKEPAPPRWKPITKILDEAGCLPKNWHKDEEFCRMQGWTPCYLKRKEK